MTVYLVVEDAPEDWGGFEILAIYLKKSKATEHVKNSQKLDHYKYQFYKVESRKVII